MDYLLQLNACLCLQWFREVFERMSKDGKELHWRSVCESDRPETMTLPDGMDDKLTRLQRALVLRALRSDRLLHAVDLFVTGALGKK